MLPPTVKGEEVTFTVVSSMTPDSQLRKRDAEDFCVSTIHHSPPSPLQQQLNRKSSKCSLQTCDKNVEV